MAEKRMEEELARLQERLRGGFVADALALAVRLQPIDRALALASKLFVAVIPLSIILASVVPGDDSFGEALVDRFGLSGAGAVATERLFASDGDVQGGVTLFGLLVVLYSTLSFANGLQRVYLDAWDLAPQGVEGLKRRGLWLLVLIGYLALLAPIRSLTRGQGLDVLYVVAALGIGSAFWLWTPYELIGRRLPRRRLVPVGFLTAVGTTGYGAFSALYVPEVFSSSAERYGLIGIAFSLVTWLFVFAAVVVCAVILAAAYDRRRHGPPIPDLGTLFRQAVDD